MNKQGRYKSSVDLRFIQVKKTVLKCCYNSLYVTYMENLRQRNHVCMHSVLAQSLSDCRFGLGGATGVQEHTTGCECNRFMTDLVVNVL